VLGAAQVAPEDAAVTVVEWVETEDPETGATVPDAALLEALTDELAETGATVLEAALLEALTDELAEETGARVLLEALTDELAGATVLLEALVELEPETGATVAEALPEAAFVELAEPVEDARVEAGVVAGAQAPEAPPIKLE